MASDKKLFAVMGADSPEKLATQLAKAFPDTHLSVGTGQWLVVGPSSMTTTEFSHRLLITDETATVPDGYCGAAIVLSVANYYGRASKGTWEWIIAKMGDANGSQG